MLSDPQGRGYAAVRIIIAGFYSTSIWSAINNTSFYEPSCHTVLHGIQTMMPKLQLQSHDHIKQITF